MYLRLFWKSAEVSLIVSWRSSCWPTARLLPRVLRHEAEVHPAALADRAVPDQLPASGIIATLYVEVYDGNQMASSTLDSNPSDVSATNDSVQRIKLLTSDLTSLIIYFCKRYINMSIFTMVMFSHTDSPA